MVIPPRLHPSRSKLLDDYWFRLVHITARHNCIGRVLKAHTVTPAIASVFFFFFHFFHFFMFSIFSFLHFFTIFYFFSFSHFFISSFLFYFFVFFSHFFFSFFFFVFVFLLFHIFHFPLPPPFPLRPPPFPSSSSFLHSSRPTSILLKTSCPQTQTANGRFRERVNPPHVYLVTFSEQQFVDSLSTDYGCISHVSSESGNWLPPRR